MTFSKTSFEMLINRENSTDLYVPKIYAHVLLYSLPAIPLKSIGILTVHKAAHTHRTSASGAGISIVTLLEEYPEDLTP